jgi:hypothetical protein
VSAIPRIPSDPDPGPELSPATAAIPDASAPSVETSHPGSRVRLSAHPGEHASDGVWWPRTTDLLVEVPLLDVAVQGLTRARIGRVAYERGRWTDAPSRVRTPLGVTHLGWFEHSRYPDHVLLSLANYQRLVLTVLPAGDGDAARGMFESAEG